MHAKSANKKKVPVRVFVRCAWSGARLAVPTTGDNLPPIRGSSTLLDIVLRLESALPPSLFHGDAEGSGLTSEAFLVCIRTVVPQSQWETTSLQQILGGDDGSSGVVLTLDLGATTTRDASKSRTKTDPMKEVIDSAASSMNIKAVVSTAGMPASTSASEPAMPTPTEISNHAADHSPSAAGVRIKMLPEQAWKKILQSNFDATSKDCLCTLLKIIDNLLSHPSEPKVRSIRCANAAFQKKVGRCSGGYEFLFSIGFIPKCSVMDGRLLHEGHPEILELMSEDECRDTLLQGREVLTNSAVRDLGMKEQDLPVFPEVPARLPSSTLMAPSNSTAASRANSRGPTGFNVYKTHSYNIQSAAVGVSDPYSDASSSMSATEKQLQQLQAKKDKMERKMQANIEMDRGLAAYCRGSGQSAMEATSIACTDGNAGGKGDSSLIAARMKRIEEERKKREEGGFTTKAMRDLERMKKAKVYSHTQIRVNFPDGTHLHAKFLPREKISVIRSVIMSAFQPALAQSLDFDLYVSPPRRLLIETNTLEEEELVPAAKIHVSWRGEESPSGSGGGHYIRKDLFNGGNVDASAFPHAKPIVKEQNAPSNLKGKTDSINNDHAQSKEELLMQRMLGRQSNFLRQKSSGNGSNNNHSNAKKGVKPRWFNGKSS